MKFYLKPSFKLWATLLVLVSIVATLLLLHSFGSPILDATLKSPFLEELRHIAIAVLGYAIAAAGVILVLIILRTMGWSGPIDLIGFVEQTVKGPKTATVNVEYRDARGSIFNPGRLVKGSLRNGVGRSYNLLEGVFMECNPDVIKAGAVVETSLQDGIFRESLPLQLDYEKQVLFVQSSLTMQDILKRINRSEKNVGADL